MMLRDRPVVLISCSNTEFEIPGIGRLHYQSVFDQYVDAVATAFDCTPVLLPALDGRSDLCHEYVRLADGAILTGAISNVAPEIYGGTLPEPPEKRDARRDQTVLPFVRAAIAEGLPLLGICRGLQEINVALGGTLHQRVHDVPGRLDHRAQRDRAFRDRYLPSHALHVRKGGWLERILVARGIAPDALHVNSLHGQAIDVLGQSVVVEATAEDGTIEAIRVAGAPALTLGVQWHAEWYVQQTPLHAAIFDELRRACLARRSSRTTSSVSPMYGGA